MCILMWWRENETLFPSKVICIWLPLARLPSNEQRPPPTGLTVTCLKDWVSYIESCNAALASPYPLIYCEALICDAAITAGLPAIMGCFKGWGRHRQEKAQIKYCTSTKRVFANFSVNYYMGGFLTSGVKRDRSHTHWRTKVTFHTSSVHRRACLVLVLKWAEKGNVSMANE